MEIRPGCFAEIPLFSGRRLHSNKKNPQFRVRARDSLEELATPGRIPRSGSVPNDQFGHVPCTGAFQKRLRHIVAREVYKFRFPLLRLLSERPDTLPARIVTIARLLDMNDEALRLQALCQPDALGNEPLLRFRSADAHHQALSRRPDRLDAIGNTIAHDVGVHAIGDAPQSDLAQRNEVPFPEKVLAGVLDSNWDIDLSGIQTRQQIIRRQVDEHHFYCVVEYAVGHGFTDRSPYDAGCNIGDAFKVLYVERRVDVDARSQELFNVAPAFGMAASHWIAVSQFVD